MKAVSTDLQNGAISGEVNETGSSELKKDRQTNQSSSKLVLVVGGSGGVGKYPFIYLLPHILLHYWQTVYFVFK